LAGDEFDADVLLHLQGVWAWWPEPRRYIDEVYQAFRRGGRYRDSVERKNRCVRIRYANLCHVDVVPYLLRGPFREKVIVNHAENRFEPADPDGFTAWIHRQNRRANGKLIKTIRLYKYLRDRTDAFAIPSVILTTLLGKQTRWWWDTLFSYPDLPTAFKIITARLDNWLHQYSSLPRIPDPSGSGASFQHRWNDRSFQHFQIEVNKLNHAVTRAYAETNQIASVLMWKRVFGPAF